MTHKKTNAVRIMEGYKVPFELIEYEIDEVELSAEDAAAKTHVPEEQTFKTLCVRGDKSGVIMVCVPGGRELDLKALAHISANKRTELVKLSEVISKEEAQIYTNPHYGNLIKLRKEICRRNPH